MANKPGWGEGRDGIDQKTGKPWFLFDHTPWIVAEMQTRVRKIGEKLAQEREQRILDEVLKRGPDG